MCHDVSWLMRKKRQEWFLFLKVKELPTFKDADFRNNMQKVYVSEEEKEKILDKLSRDIEVRKLCCRRRDERCGL